MQFAKCEAIIQTLKIEFIMKSNESLTENKIKNKIEQLLSKCKHGNNIHEHRKQQNEKTT